MRTGVNVRAITKAGGALAFGLALCLGLIGGQASAGMPAGAPSGITAAQSSKIEARVLKDTADGKAAEFMVVMASQADVSAGHNIKNHDERGWYVYNTLKAHAERTQSGIRSVLGASNVSHKSFWALNALLVSGDRTLVEAIAARSDVGRIVSNHETRWIENPKIANVSEANASPNTTEWGVNNVNAPQVWAMGFTGQGIVIANQDTGMRWSHNAIKPKYRGWDGVTANHNYNWWDAIHSGGGICGPNTQIPCDDNGHGTHTTGTTVGDDGAGNQVGVAPGAKWIGCRNMNVGNGTPATYTECFQFFIAPTDLAGQNANPALRPHVMNNSWGCPVSEGCTTRGELETIINNTSAAGIFVEASAGNSGPGCSSVNDPPSLYSASFATGATDINNNLASFSSRGPSTYYNPNILKPQVSAPGVNVRSSTSSSDSSYGNSSGTSMAGPHVVGVVALLWSARPQLVRDIDTTKTILQNTANPLVNVSPQTCGGIPSSQIPNNTFGYGRVDALAAVNSVQGGTQTPGTATVTRTPTSGVSATPTCPPGGPLVFTGSIDGTEPIKNSVNGATSTCAVSPACPGELAGTFHYDTYPITNSSANPVCITITLSDPACIYSDTYTAPPTSNGCTNYKADSNLTASYQLTIPANTTYYLVVEEFTENAGCPNYTVTVTGLPAGGCPTGTPAVTSTATRTATTPPGGTSTATATCIPGGGTGYTITTGSATMIPGGTRVDGAGCDDCVTNVTLPFPVTVYGTPSTSVDLGSNGNAQFTTGNPKLFFWDGCLPIEPTQGGPYERTLFLYNDDLRTDEAAACPTCGIFTQTLGTAPNRQFVVRWMTTYFNHAGTAQFEMVLTEGSPVLRVIYGASDNSGAEATTGIQRNLTDFNQHTCDQATLTSGLMVTYTPAGGGGCPTPPTAVATSTATRTNTVGPINTATRTNTAVPTSTRTATATATSVPCTIEFDDVPVGHTFYENVRCLACRGIISGYADGTFRPNNPVTRGQLAKMVSNAAGFTENPHPQIFADVPPTHTFYDFINRLTRRGHMTGYQCGGPGEPCINNMPYFRPFANATRGQTSKIVSNAAGFVEPPVGQTFEDVPPTHTFYAEIQRLASRNVMQGYACGGPFEPCVPPTNRPYFRPGNDVTRGQSAKIVANTFYPGCVTP